MGILQYATLEYFNLSTAIILKVHPLGKLHNIEPSYGDVMSRNATHWCMSLTGSARNLFEGKSPTEHLAHLAEQSIMLEPAIVGHMGATWNGSWHSQIYASLLTQLWGLHYPEGFTISNDHALALLDCFSELQCCLQKLEFRT